MARFFLARTSAPPRCTFSPQPADDLSSDSFIQTIERELSDIEENIADSFRTHQAHSTQSPPLQKRAKAGRKTCRYTLLLSQFSPMSKMKKDNLRTRLVRAYKRCLRDIRKLQQRFKVLDPVSLSAYWPTCFRKKTQDLRPHDLDDAKTKADWLQLIQIYCERPDLFDLASRNGPKNDGRRRQHTERHQSSYNSDYCRGFFGSEVTRRGFAAYIELVFGHKTSAELCKRFQVTCCRSVQHSEDCTKLWRQLESLLTSDEFLF